MKKWSLLACFLLIASIIIPFNHAYAASPFKDVGTSHRAHNEIAYLVQKSIAYGISSNEFAPNQQVTRGEAVALIGRSLGVNGAKQNTSFNDVGPGYFASGFIMEMVKKGVVSGYPDGTFKTNKVLTRGEMALLINRAFNFGGQSVSAAAANLMDKGIAQGLADGSFGTNATIIRADFAVFLARSLNPAFRVQPAGVSFAKTMYVNTGSDTLNMRSGPSISNPIISSLPNGTAVGVSTSSNGWSHIRANGVAGYAVTSYLSTTKPGAVLPNPKPVVKNDLKVIIDPGHGGKDAGAASNGYREKDIVLNVGKYMKSYFDESPITAKMTRDTDIFIELLDRASFASKNNGDVFISLHTNASTTGAASGQETFYSASTAAVNPNVQQSRALSIYLQARMQEAWQLKNRGVKTAKYTVTYRNTVPAALIEMGFIDNAIDIQYMKSEAERKKMGKALFLGTLDYFYHYENRSDVLTAYKTAGASPSMKLH